MLAIRVQTMLPGQTAIPNDRAGVHCLRIRTVCLLQRGAGPGKYILHKFPPMAYSHSANYNGVPNLYFVFL